MGEYLNNREDAIINDYYERVHANPTLVGAMNWTITKSGTKHVSVGLSPALDFAPVIKLWGTQGSFIIIPTPQWNDILSIDFNGIQEKVIDEYNISTYMLKDIKMFVFECKAMKIVLSQHTINFLINMGTIINYYLNILKCNDFASYYGSMINMAARIPDDALDGIKFILKNYANLPNVLIMHECMLFISDKIYDDVRTSRGIM